MAPKSWPRLRPTWGTAAVVAAVALCVLHLPTARFFADDYFLLGALERVSPLPGQAPFDLYRIADGSPDAMHALQARGVWPWFFDDQFRMRFFRPLGSALIALDHSLFGLDATGYVVSNCLWYLALVLGVAALYRRKLSAATAGPATFVYAVSGIFVQAIGWTATRPHTAAAAAAVWAYVAWSRGASPDNARWRWLGVLGFLVALGFSESALAVLAYPIIEERWGDDWRRALRRVAPLLTLAMAYLVGYVSLGFGASHGGGYTSPFSEPLEFLRNAPERAAILASALVVGGPADLLATTIQGRAQLAELAPLCLLTLYLVYRWTKPLVEVRDRAAVDRFLEGALLASLPLFAAPVFTFHMTVPFLGIAPLFGQVLGARGRWRDLDAPVRFGVYGLGSLLALFGLLVAPLSHVLLPIVNDQAMADRTVTAATALDTEIPDLARAPVIVVNAPDYYVGIEVPHYRRLMRLPMPPAWLTLFWGAGEIRLSRPDPSSLTLEWRGGGVQRLGKNVGDVIPLAGMSIEVTGVEAGRITAIRCRFERPLDEGWRLLTWHEGGFHDLRAPAVGGASTILAATM
jgi:hypothetical protein